MNTNLYILIKYPLKVYNIPVDLIVKFQRFIWVVTYTTVIAC